MKVTGTVSVTARAVSVTSYSLPLAHRESAAQSLPLENEHRQTVMKNVKSNIVALLSSSLVYALLVIFGTYSILAVGGGLPSTEEPNHIIILASTLLGNWIPLLVGFAMSFVALAITLLSGGTPAYDERFLWLHMGICATVLVFRSGGLDGILFGLVIGVVAGSVGAFAAKCAQSCARIIYPIRGTL